MRQPVDLMSFVSIRVPSRIAFALLVLALAGFVGCASDRRQSVQTGLDVAVENGFELLEGKRVGVITNHTGLSKDGRHIIDLLHEAEGVTLTAIFGPEHGIRGAVSAGKAVKNGIDETTGVPVYSLYGRTKKPTIEMLSEVDALVFDIQDVGARFYTYVSTMAHAMNAAAEQGKMFVVLDRPNPLGGRMVEGPMLDTRYASFVGMFPTPIRHGLTVGELARLFHSERWVANGLDLDLYVVRMTGWDRDDWYDDTDLEWVAPSPNMPTLVTATVYPGTCLFEGTNVSEGRGTPRPFEWIGAPWIDGDALAADLNALALAGVSFEAITFTPEPDPVRCPRPKFRGQRCEGVKLRVLDRTTFEPVKAAVAMIRAIAVRHPRSFAWRSTIDRLFGSGRLRHWIAARTELREIFDEIDASVAGLRTTWDSVLLYRD